MKIPKLFFSLAVVLLFSGCATGPLAERALGYPIPIARSAVGEAVASIVFSAEQKYETRKGVPLMGDPLICGREGIFRVNDDSSRVDQVTVKAGEEIAVTSVIEWLNTGFRKTCWPFVTFVPESGAKYIVVNERIGGKGASALWTGIAFQTCMVFVYKENSSGFQRVDTQKSSTTACQSSQQ